MASGWSEEWEWLECEGESKGLVGGSNRILNKAFAQQALPWKSSLKPQKQ